MNIIALLKQALNKNLINNIDFYFSTYIATEKEPEIMLAAACLSYSVSCGHVCLPILNLKNKLVFPKKEKKLINKLWNAAGNPKNWTEILLKSDKISHNTNVGPLVLYEKKLYLNYLWQAEKKVFSFILNNKQEKSDIILFNITLKSLFHKKNNDCQKIAVAMTMIWKIIFIIGGPGTGKTTAITRILLALIRISKKKIRIKLAAPTGKASARLTESLRYALKEIKFTELEKDLLPKQAITLHSLLGITQENNKPFFNTNNILNVDVLIIDESSMIDLLLMEKLIDALPKEVKVIFLGDIYTHHHHAYSYKTAKILKNITECEIKIIDKNLHTTINDSICILKKKYRFNPISDISKLEEDLNKHSSNLIKKIFLNKYKNVFYHEIICNNDYLNMIFTIVKEYSKYLNVIKTKKNPKTIIKTFNKYRVLCAIRNGIYGVNNINRHIEKKMEYMNLIQPYKLYDNTWYTGKPIMITKNNKSLGLFNGDIGITILDNKKKLKVFFSLNEHDIKIIPIELISEYETTWVMTIHKAQGSEFKHVVLILPNIDYTILTKELLYTAVTRACDKLTIYAEKKTFLKIINKKNIRYSGFNT